MTTTGFMISRADLSAAFGGNERVVRQFEEMQRQVAETGETAGANVEATAALKEASFITLSGNSELPNEYVLEVSEGLRIVAEDGVLRLYLDAPIVTGGFTVRLIATSDAELVLPVAGVLATRTNPELLENKTLAAPKLDGLEAAADDAAAAAAGVAVGQMYRNGSALMVRVT